VKAARVTTADLNRSLQRGMEILRAFRPGSDLHGNGEIAERTGLSRATVSRLAQTLVDCGMLEHDRRRRAYRLAAPVLSLAHAMRSGSPVLAAAGPLIRREAERHKINVGLAAADRDEMVYLESVRYSRRVLWRNVVAGQRVPMELTSLGHAYLAAAQEYRRKELFAHFRSRRPAAWPALSREILAAIASVRQLGYCCAHWQPEVVAIATPIVLADYPIYALNMSVSGTLAPEDFVRAFHEPLLDLARRIKSAVELR
jgi:DNA-binding IclR family transcriptional regulator